jgi:hypothetical protein
MLLLVFLCGALPGEEQNQCGIQTLKVPSSRSNGGSWDFSRENIVNCDILNCDWTEMDQNDFADLLAALGKDNTKTVGLSLKQTGMTETRCTELVYVMCCCQPHKDCSSALTTHCFFENDLCTPTRLTTSLPDAQPLLSYFAALAAIDSRHIQDLFLS